MPSAHPAKLSGDSNSPSRVTRPLALATSRCRGWWLFYSRRFVSETVPLAGVWTAFRFSSVLPELLLAVFHSSPDGHLPELTGPEKKARRHCAVSLGSACELRSVAAAHFFQSLLRLCRLHGLPGELACFADLNWKRERGTKWRMSERAFS